MQKETIPPLHFLSTHVIMYSQATKESHFYRPQLSSDRIAAEYTVHIPETTYNRIGPGSLDDYC